MDYRKLIKFGDNSFVISVPKPWLKKNRLEKGSLLYVTENGNNELVFTPEKKEIKEVLTTVVIDTKGKTRLEIKREIIAAYINDYSILKIIGLEIESNLRGIRDIIKNLVAVEIIEQTSDKIIAQDFLNIHDTSFEKIVRRIDTLIRSIFIDIDFKTIKDCYESILVRDSDINRLTYLCFKIIRRAMRYPSVAQEFKLAPTQLLDYWLIILKLEKIGDALKRISRLLKKFSANKVQREEVIALFEHVKESYLKLMKAYYANDAKTSRKISDDRRTALTQCVQFGERYQNFKTNKLVENFKDIHCHIGDISRVVYMQEIIKT